MNTIKLMLAAAVASVSIGAIAAEMTDTTRDQRMNAALQDYRSGQPMNGESKTRHAENKVKEDAHKAGAAIKRGATKTGHAIEHGVHKTGEAIHHAGEKMKGDDSTTKP